jgi:hypothetical protein
MLHLSTERLAALADETPSPAELAHLSSCDDCTREREAFASLGRLASLEATRIGTPLTTWEALAPALVADGVIDTGRGFRVHRRAGGRRWVQAAAALFLVAGGVAAGRFSADVGSARRVASARPNVADPATSFNSVDAARAAQLQSQQLYQSATAFIAANDTTSRAVESTSTIRTRLAALDRVREVVGEALNEAPYDPVINGYYLTTTGQREATLRQLNTSLPAGTRLVSY